VRFLSGVLLLLAGLGQLQSAIAQQSVSISPSVVLVLKLVSSTLVKPTTGIVISDDGMVLVPAEFASAEGEMIVLDGGADILSHGRPAKLVAGVGSGDLAVLSVKGLNRPGIKLSGNRLHKDGALHLEAFPPAEYIAKGAQPLRLPVKVTGDGLNSKFSISPQTPLPYVTGAILDACGNLAGVSLTSGPQSLDSGKLAPVLFNEDLDRVFAVMQIKLPSAVCQSPAAETVTPVLTKAGSDTRVATEEAREPVAENKPGNTIIAAAPGANAGSNAGAIDEQPVDGPGQQAAVASAAQATVARTGEPLSLWRSIPAWLVLLAGITLGVIVWKGVRLSRPGSEPAVPAQHSALAVAVQPASDEPDTAPLAAVSDNHALKPRSAPVVDFDLPASGTRPDGCNGLLLIEGMLEADTAFRRFCFVDTGRIDAIIGRGDTDIAIEHTAISRAHARIQSDGEYLTFADLGSRNGSFIGDVPCLPGEIMFLETDDELFLGDVKMTVRVVTQEADWA
jgi:hypothetical protein